MNFIELLPRQLQLRTALYIFSSISFIANLVFANELDGIYTKRGHEELCNFTCDGSGYDNVNLLRICKSRENEYFVGAYEETTCTYTNQTNVRGMNAWLFDAECSAEGEPFKYRTMLMRSENGVFEIFDGFVEYYESCK